MSSNSAKESLKKLPFLNVKIEKKYADLSSKNIHFARLKKLLSQKNYKPNDGDIKYVLNYLNNPFKKKTCVP